MIFSERRFRKLRRWMDEGKQGEKKFQQFVEENRETILKLLHVPIKPRKYRQSGHFVDQKLKYAIPDQNPTIFDLISSETKEKISRHGGVGIRAEGIRLTPPQDKLINALLHLLYLKSESRDEASRTFYGGNVPAQIVPYGGKGQQGRSAIIRITPAELYKAYLNKSRYSGADIRFIKSVLHDTEQQKFLIIYERKYQESGRRELKTDRIEDFQSLFKILHFFEGLTEEQSKQLDQGAEGLREKKSELIIAFNPILTDQIHSKYVEYPEDINRRTMIAAGGHRLVTESVIALRDWMLREISVKRKVAEINEDRLPFVLKLDQYVKEGRKKLILERTDKAIQVVKNLSLITKHERVNGAQGQWKHVFTLNS